MSVNMNNKNDKYIVKRRETIVIPNSVETGNKLNKYLSIGFLTWSIIVIICYFSEVNIPEVVDISISMFAIGVSVVHSLYNYYCFKSHNLYSIGPEPKKYERKNALNVELSNVLQIPS